MRPGGPALAPLVVVALIGCGSGSATKTVTAPAAPAATSTTSGVTAATGGDAKARFAAKGDAVCGEFNPQLTAANARIRAIQANRTLTRDQKVAQLARAVRDGAAVFGRGLVRLQALSPPPQDAAIYRRYVAALSRQRVDLAALQRALETKALTSIVVINNRIQRDRGQAQGFAQAYGFKECGRDTTAPPAA